jgi:succinate dehydrogenase/fumarate reductase flavoprotein subunit
VSAEPTWDLEADVVVIGAGAAGVPAAIAAREAGASVIVVEAEDHIGGHAILTSGNIALGGGTAAQAAHGIVDSPDLLFRDLTDWSIVQANGAADYRYNDRAIVRAFADNSARTYEWLLAHGVTFIDQPPCVTGQISAGNSAPRVMRSALGPWPTAQTGRPVDPELRATTPSGAGLMRPLELAANRAGVRFLLGHKMTALHRTPGGRVSGIAAETAGRAVQLRAHRAVIVATGGSTGNVNFRRMFDPRLTEEYCGLAGMPWSDQNASGELAAMAIGASLWGLANQTGEFGANFSKAELIGCQYNYRFTQWMPESPVFAKARASGLFVRDWHDTILVNMLGRRFYDETATGFRANRYTEGQHYVHGDYRNARDIVYAPQNFLNAALAGFGDGHNGGGPIWAVFDAAAVAREGWDPRPPNVDVDAGFFFTANTLGELARAIRMRFQRVPMPPAELEATVARYNGFVDAGVDADFAKPAPRHKIAVPPFYAAWATPVPHDTRAGLRITPECEVVDFTGAVIPGLYCGGESAGGFSLHGLARAICQGVIAGNAAAAQRDDRGGPSTSSG